MFTNPVSYVSVGSMSADLIQLSAAILRSVGLQLTGSGMGSWPSQHIATAIRIQRYQLKGRLYVHIKYGFHTIFTWLAALLPDDLVHLAATRPQ